MPERVMSVKVAEYDTVFHLEEVEDGRDVARGAAAIWWDI